VNAAVVHAFDAPPSYATFADPVPLEGEKLVTITAAGLHPIAKLLANGIHFGSARQASSAVIASPIDQPTMRRLNRSNTTARYSHPSPVGI